MMLQKYKTFRKNPIINRINKAMISGMMGAIKKVRKTNNNKIKIHRYKKVVNNYQIMVKNKKQVMNFGMISRIVTNKMFRKNRLKMKKVMKIQENNCLDLMMMMMMMMIINKKWNKTIKINNNNIKEAMILMILKKPNNKVIKVNRLNSTKKTKTPP